MSHNSSRFLAKVKNSSYILTRTYNEFLMMYILFAVHTTPLPTGEGLGVGLLTFQSTPQGSSGSASCAAGTEGYYLVPQSPDSDV